MEQSNFFIHGQIYQPQDKHRCQDGLYLIFQRQEGHARRGIPDMYSYQAVIPALHMEGMQTSSVTAQVSTGPCGRPAAKAGNSRYKTGCCRGTTRLTGEIHTTSRRPRRSYLTPKVSTSVMVLAPVAAGLAEEADGKSRPPMPARTVGTPPWPASCKTATGFVPAGQSAPAMRPTR